MMSRREGGGSADVPVVRARGGKSTGDPANEPNGTAPANPPFPACWYLPFHVEAGSQTSRPMCESGLGVETTATRQNAGRLLNTWPLMVNEPAGTDCASVTVACGSESEVRLVQVAARAGAADHAAAAAARAARGEMRRTMGCFLPGARCGCIVGAHGSVLSSRELKTR